MTWANTKLLWLLIVPLALILFYLKVIRQNRRDLERFAQPDLLEKIVDFSGQKLRNRQLVWRVLGLTMIVLALAGPQWGYRWEKVQSHGLEIIFALDTSKSMLAADLKPSRLERAKLAVKDCLSQLSGDKVGLIAFSGTSFLQCPLTLDYNAFAIALDSLNVHSIPRGGTAIGAAIATARNAFKSGSSGSKILVLMTDGENHEGDPVAQAKAAAKEGISVNTIGMGSPQGELIVVADEQGNTSYLKDSQGNVVKSTLDEAELRRIARVGNGTYLRAAGLSMGLDQLFQTKLKHLNKSTLSSKWKKRQLNRYQIPLSIAFLFLSIEILSGAKKQFQWWPRFKFRHKKSSQSQQV
ncbi:MAG TPA: VWA domain-containing protein [Bacillota bacterium]